MTLPDKSGKIPILKARCIQWLVGACALRCQDTVRKHILCDHRPQTEYTNRVLVMKQNTYV